ncbi:MAG: hypothetical protein GY842_06340 [bacterium]|nr:hypothetical protein [bacterium]
MNRHRIPKTFVFLLVLALTFGVASVSEPTEPAADFQSAWNVLLEDYPCLAEDRSVPAEQRRILQALPAEAADAYLAGEDPHTIFCPVVTVARLAPN